MSLVKLTSCNSDIYVNPEKISALYPMCPVTGSPGQYNCCVMIEGHSFYVLDKVEDILQIISERA